jgi:hypothetical protein
VARGIELVRSPSTTFIPSVAASLDHTSASVIVASVVIVVIVIAAMAAFCGGLVAVAHRATVAASAAVLGRSASTVVIELAQSSLDPSVEVIFAVVVGVLMSWFSSEQPQLLCNVVHGVDRLCHAIIVVTVSMSVFVVGLHFSFEGVEDVCDFFST